MSERWSGGGAKTAHGQLDIVAEEVICVGENVWVTTMLAPRERVAVKVAEVAVVASRGQLGGASSRGEYPFATWQGPSPRC